ncbi:rhoptry neck protein 12, putative [Plasmodium malariae]|uniref:Rhoptry neck protein 12, putative n=1 Tax=Plasmodium malariae TaxID=5858 RepID=A0A1C3K9G9_PLAMA|nr:rhoptry neck protein 12, putative [Plasmodium malariae]
MRKFCTCSYFFFVYIFIVCNRGNSLRFQKGDGNAIGAVEGNGKNGSGNNVSTDTNNINAKESTIKNGDNKNMVKEEKSNSEANTNTKKFQNFVSSKNEYLGNKGNEEYLKNMFISDGAFESAKNVCENVVVKNEYFKSFCKNTELFKEIQKLKKNSHNLYEQVISDSYENVNTSTFKLLKDDGDKKLIMETDDHNPKVSIMFLYEKLCVGGIPLVCSKILKVDNIFDLNQNNEKNDLVQENNYVNDMEKELTTTINENNGVEENVSDLTDDNT